MLSACSANPQSSEAASSLSSESEASQTSISSSVSEEEFTVKIQSFVGGWTTQNDSAVSKSSNNLGVVTNHTLSKGLIRLRMSANGKGDSGIIFGSEAMPTAYYSFFVTTSGGNQIKLMKKTGEGNQELRSCYITAGYSETANVELAVEFDQGDIKCFLNGSMLLSYKDEEPLTGDRFGFMSKNAGSLFDDITIEDQGMFKPVDTLIIGHSYMELWSDYKNDLDRYPDIANIGIGGTATTDWIGHRAEVKAYQPNRLIYMIGINDYPRGTKAEEIMENIRVLIDGVLSDLKETNICILSVNQCPIFPEYKEEINKTNDLLKLYVASSDRLFYGDLDKAFLKEDGTSDPSCFVDGLHPTKEAYKVIAQAIYDGFDGVMPPLPSVEP